MKLYYYKDPRGNFGDDLNVWLWPKLLHNLIDVKNPCLFGSEELAALGEDDTIFIGIGTMINHHVPEAPRKVVFGSGVGYGETPTIDEKWTIYGVRGPLSANALGLDKQFSISDSGILVRAANLPPLTKRYKLAFMPYHRTIDGPLLKLGCNALGIKYIDPSDNVENILRDIQMSELLVAEAMHGAIIADALRTPWIPVKINASINEFKWNDWCQSLNMKYEPYSIPTLWPLPPNPTMKDKLLRQKRLLGLCRHIKRAAERCAPSQSSEETINTVTARQLEKIEQLKHDLGAPSKQTISASQA